MKRSMYILLFILLLVFIPNLYSQEKLSGNVFSSGGNFSNNLLYNLRGTAGQVLLGKNSNTINFNNVGFWYIKKDVITNTEEEHDNLPKIFSLSQNYPNPFNPQTRIKYDLPHTGKVLMKVYNIVGEEICTLVDEVKPAASFEVLWDGRDNTGHRVATGVYLYQLEVQDPSTGSGQGLMQTRRMLLLE
jgi:hypothetical protein